MAKRYSVYEAKAKFSEMMRVVLAHGQAIITQRGTPVIRMIPYAPENESLDQRLAGLAGVGRARLARKRWPSKRTDVPADPTRVPEGAVQRFLDERE